MDTLWEFMTQYLMDFLVIYPGVANGIVEEQALNVHGMGLGADLAFDLAGPFLVV
jgi:hypothetical protein